MMRCVISEKALEMNVSENFVRIVRNYVQKAYIYGYSTRIEAHHGLDCSINIPCHMSVVSFQFKRPGRMSSNTYTFVVNRKGKLQLFKVAMFALLIKMILRKDPHIYYALPCICDACELEAVSPNFADRTLFIPALDLVHIADPDKHEVVVDICSRRYIVRSKQKYEGKALTFEELLNKILMGLKKREIPTAEELGRLHIPIEKLKEILIASGMPRQSIEMLFEELTKRGKRSTTIYFRALVL